MTEEEPEQQGPGRPRKDPTEKIPWHTKSFYFPIDKRHKAIWDEFDRICKERDPIPELYHKNVFCRKGVIVRELIMKYVIGHTRRDIIKEVIKEVISREHADRIDRYEKDTGKTYRREGQQPQQEQQNEEETVEEEATEEPQDVEVQQDERR